MRPTALKCLSVKEPWASLIACGDKTVETRTWRTGYRGDLLICASAAPDIMQAGQAVAIARLVGCEHMTEEHEDAALCAVYPRAWAWRLETVRRIVPFLVSGQRGLYERAFPVTQFRTMPQREPGTCRLCGIGPGVSGMAPWLNHAQTLCNQCEDELSSLGIDAFLDMEG